MLVNKGAGCTACSSSEVSESDTTELYLSISTPLVPSAFLRRTRGQGRLACPFAALLSPADVLACECEELASAQLPSVLLLACSVRAWGCAAGPLELAELLEC